MRCPGCESAELESFFELPDVPVLCNRLWPDESAARQAPQGRIELGFCSACGMIHNVAFDAGLLHYDQSYENSLHFSPRFQEYAQELAGRLIERHGLRGKDVVEIGSGKGDFLRLLCETGGNRGVGFDHSHEGDDSVEGPGWSVRFVRDYYGEAYGELPADLVCCRHVLEHIARPAEFLGEIRRVAARQVRPVVYFEVPNALWTLRDLGVWDVIYEHCSYFTPQAIARVFGEAGFVVQDVYDAFGGQFLCAEAGTSDAVSAYTPPGTDELSRLVASFAEHFRAKVERWREGLAAWSTEGRRSAIWGAGSKGVTFLNSVDRDRTVLCAVDINPRKQGRFLPGTGQPVVSPERAVEQSVDNVLVMNPLYAGEIESRLRELGSRAEVSVV